MSTPLVAPVVAANAVGIKIANAAGGSVDISTMSGFGQVFPAIDRGAPIKILAGGSLLPVLALFSGRPGIKTLQDLAGKTLGTGSIGALVHQLTVTLLQKYGVDTAGIRFVNIGSSADIFRAVAAGTVDGGAVDAALIGNATEHRVHLIEHGNYRFVQNPSSKDAFLRARHTVFPLASASDHEAQWSYIKPTSPSRLTWY